MKRFYLWIMLMTLWGMSGRLYAATESNKLQATHIGYYDDGTVKWWMYYNEHEYYAKCYLGANTVTAPTWVSDVLTLTDEKYTTTNTSTSGSSTTSLIAIPIAYLFEDAPSGASTYTVPNTDNTLKYTVVDQGAMATIYNVVLDNALDASQYSANNPLVLTVPDEVTFTPNGSNTTIEKVKITRLGVAQWGDNYYTHLGDAINTLGVPVRLKLGANIQAIMANTFRVNNGYDESLIQGCTNLYGFDFNGNTALWYIGNGAFKDATNLKLYPISKNDDHAVAVPTSLTQLQDEAFANSGIRSLIVTQPIQNLGNDVFENCDNMEYVSFKQLNMTASDGTTNNMLLSRDIDKFKETLKNNGTEVTTTEVKPEYQRLLQGIPNHVLIYAPNAFDKTYTYLDQSENGYNIITTKDATPHCYHFYVYDNTTITDATNNKKGSYDYWVPEAFEADVSTYNRAFPTGWVTTYLPFNWTLPEGCKAYQADDPLVAVNSEGQHVFSFTEVSGTTMTANTPYLLNNTSGKAVTIADASSQIIPKSVRPPYKTFLNDDHKTKALFWGTTEDISNDSAAVNYQAYNIRPDQKWGKVVTSVPTGYIGHFRAFVSDTRTTTSSSAKPNVVLMLIGKNGETTSISTVDAGAVIGGQAAIYALDGRYMGTDFTRLPNGIYIKNGKKFTVKNR